jgi:hypothetical protein
VEGERRWDGRGEEGEAREGKICSALSMSRLLELFYYFAQCSPLGIHTKKARNTRHALIVSEQQVEGKKLISLGSDIDIHSSLSSRKAEHTNYQFMEEFIQRRASQLNELFLCLLIESPRDDNVLTFATA